MADDHAADEDSSDEDERPRSSLLAATEPGEARRNLSPSAGSGELPDPTEDANGAAQTPHVIASPGWESGPSSADRIDLSDRYTRSVLEVPIGWLGLTPPSGSVHLKLMNGGDAHRVDIWSSGVPLDEQMAWARSQGGWDIRGEYHARSFVVSFAVDSPPKDLVWLAQLSSYQRLDLHPDGTVHVHLSGPRQDVREAHRRLRRATDVEVVRVADAEDEDLPFRDPPLATA